MTNRQPSLWRSRYAQTLTHPALGSAGEGASGTKRGVEPIVLGAHGVAAIDPLEPAHGEMTARHILEVLDKSEVESRSTQRADDRDGLRSEFLRNDEAETRRDLRQE